MNEWLKVFIRLIECMIILVIGLWVTNSILKPIYEQYGISLLGNVWVNWFGVSYLIFVWYSLLLGLSLTKENNFYKQRITSTFFWVLCMGAIYVVFVPFVKGENPF